LLDHAPVLWRHRTQQAIWRLAAASVRGFRRVLDGQGFTEIHTPKLVASSTESGANVFTVDYFGRPAYLAQSPQFYKQIMVGVFGRVYETGPVFRAEPHDTVRHLAEYVSLDVEVGFITDHRDVVAVLRDVLAGRVAEIRATAGDDAQLVGACLPEVPDEIPINAGFIEPVKVNAPGAFRRGLAIRRVVELLADRAVLSLPSHRRTTPPYGLHGGARGTSSATYLHRYGSSELLPAKTTVRVKRGDLVEHITAKKATTTQRKGSYMTSRTTELQRILKQDGPVVVPGATDCFIAKLIERAGFPIVYVTGAGATNTLLGEPDLGLITLTELASQAGRISEAVSVPVIADCDTGFGGVANVKRTVRAYERAGVAGLHIEDQVSPKRCGHFEGKAVVPVDEMLFRLQAALDARIDPDFLIIARTDARAMEGLDSAIERARARSTALFDMLTTLVAGGTETTVRLTDDFAAAPLRRRGLPVALEDTLCEIEILSGGLRIIRERMAAAERQDEPTLTLISELRAVARRLTGAGDSLTQTLNPPQPMGRCAGARRGDAIRASPPHPFPSIWRPCCGTISSLARGRRSSPARLWRRIPSLPSSAGDSA